MNERLQQQSFLKTKMLQQTDSTRLIAAAILFLLTLLMGTLPVYVFEFFNTKLKRNKIHHQHPSSRLAELESSSSSIELSPSNDVGERMGRKFWSDFFQRDRIVQFLTQIGGGVLLYTAFVHMLPEIRENYETYLRNSKNNTGLSLFAIDPSVIENLEDQNGKHSTDNDGDGDDDSYPLVDLMASVGLFGIFLLEELMSFVFGTNHHHHHHHHHNGNNLLEKGHRFSLKKSKYKQQIDEGIIQNDPEQTSHSHQLYQSKHMEPINLMTKNDCSNKMKPTITIEIEANTIGTTTSTGDMLSPESPMNKKKNPNGNLLLSALSETHPISSNRKQMHCYNTCEQQCSKHLSSIRSKPINEKEERRYYHSDDTKQESDENSENNETIDEEEEESIWPYIVENFLLILAFSCHSIFDGISIGVQADENEIWTMLIAILSHKLLIAFMLSFQIYEKCRPRVRLEAYRAEQDLIDHLNGYHHHHHHQNNQDHHHHHHHQRSENHLDQSRNESIRHAKTILWLFSTLFAAMSPIGILIVIIMNDSVSRPSESSLHIIVLASISAGTILYIVFIEIIGKLTSRTHLNGFFQWLALVLGFTMMYFISQSFHE